MVRFASLFNMKEQTVTFVSGATYSLEALRTMGMSELLGTMFEFSHKLAVLELNAQELGLFTAVVLVSAGGEQTLYLRNKRFFKLSVIMFSNSRIFWGDNFNIWNQFSFIPVMYSRFIYSSAVLN